MTIYIGKAENEIIDGSTLPLGIDWIDAGLGDDTVRLVSAQGYIAGPGKNVITGNGYYNTYAFWYAAQFIDMNLETGVVSNNGFGGTDQISGLNVVQTGSKGSRIIANSANNTFWINGGSNAIYGNGGSDIAVFWQQDSASFDISYDNAIDGFIVAGKNTINYLYQVQQLQFSDKTFMRSNYVGDFRTITVALSWNKPTDAFISSLRTGDFNGDGFSDLMLLTQISTGTAPSPMLILSGDGAGNFVDETNLLFEKSVSLIGGGGRTLVGDFNNDFTSDIFQLDFGNDAPPFSGGQNSLFLSSKSQGKLIDISKTLSQSLELNHGGCIGDVNNDNFLDVVVNSLSGGNQLWINDGFGYFTRTFNSIPSTTFLDQNGVSQHSTNTYSGLFDLNSDGFKDLILGTWQINAQSYVLLNDGHGGFFDTKKSALPHSSVYSAFVEEIVIDVKPIDIDNDGVPEIMLSITNGGSPGNFYLTPYIQFLKSDEDGFVDITDRVLPQPSVPGSSWWYQLYPCDFNHDGYQDFLAVVAGDGSSTIFMNGGDGTFYPGASFNAGDLAVVADYNNDGMSDIITANSSDITVWTNSLSNAHVYRANFGGDSLLGSLGDDFFYSGDGNDTLNGNGGLDVALYRGKVSDYVISQNDNFITIHDNCVGRDGSDKITNIHKIQFSDTAIFVPVLRSELTAMSVENTASLSTVYTTVAAKSGNNIVPAYSISGGADAALFNINATTGAITFKTPPNFEAPTDAGANNVYDITVQASDGSLAASQAVAITVTNVNEAPSVTSVATAATTENVSTSTAVYTTTATDPDGNTTLSYSISGGADASLFNINSPTGAVTFKVSPNYEAPTDADANNIYDIIVQASDGSLTAAKAVAVTVTDVPETKVGMDLNGDAHSDILLQSESSGACYVWQMNGLSLIPASSNGYGYVGWTPGNNWQAKATGDFNADGKSDILLQNTADGACYVWETNGANNPLVGNGYVGWTPGKDWQAKATGDFNGDGKSDILLQNANDGSCYVWQMNGLNLLTNGNGFVGWTPGKDWQVKGTGDFNGDGKSDILLQNSNDGSCYIWELNGTSQLVGNGYVGWTPGIDWVAKGTGDVNGDGKSDILLQNANDGTCYIWELNGTGPLVGNGYVGWTPGKAWEAKGTGDFNGDGKSDILLQNAVDGTCYVWETNGVNNPLVGNGYVGWTPGADWHAVA